MAENDHIGTPSGLVPATEKTTFMGQETSPLFVEGYGPIPQGFFSAFGKAAYTGGIEVMNRWSGLGEYVSGVEETISPEAFDEMVGERDIEFDRGMSPNEVERRISIYDRDEYVANFQSRPVAEFFGMIPPYVFDPTSVATFPLGAANFGRAVVSKTFGGFLRENAIGGAKLAAGTAPLEVGVQLADRGEIDGGELVGAITGSLVAPTVLGLPPRAIRGLGRSGRADTADGAANHPSMRPDKDPAEAAGAIDEAGDIPAPPVTPRTKRLRPTRKLMERDFEDYNGGVRQFFRDAAARTPDAVIKASRLGIDLDDAGIRGAIKQIGYGTDASGRTPQDYNEALLQDLRSDSAAGRQRLFSAGLIDNAGNIREQYRPVADAARKAEGTRNLEESKLLYDFIGNGLAPQRQRAAAKLDREIKEIQKELRPLREMTRGKKRTKRTNQARARAEQLRNQWLAKSIQKDNLLAGPRIVDDSIPDERLLEVIEHARMERDPGPGPEPVEVPEEVTPLADRLEQAYPEMRELDADMQNWMKSTVEKFSPDKEQSAQEIDDINAMLTELDESTRSCRIG